MARIFLCCLLWGMLSCTGEVSDISHYNVVWNTPGDGSFDSIPLGNGDIGLNVWAERNGDILFYISRVDAFDAGHLLPKPGRVGIKAEPLMSVDHFMQTPNLTDASVLIEAGDADFRIWVDAGQPVVRVKGKNRIPLTITIRKESLGPFISSSDSLPRSGIVCVLFNDNENRLAWCCRNQSSRWGENFRLVFQGEKEAPALNELLLYWAGAHV